MEQNILIAIISLIGGFFIIFSICITWGIDTIVKILRDILSVLNKKTWTPLKEQSKKTIIYKISDSTVQNKITFNLDNLVGKELANRIKEIANDLDIKKYDVYDSFNKRISHTDVISYCYMEFPLYLFSSYSQDQKTWIS